MSKNKYAPKGEATLGPPMEPRYSAEIKIDRKFSAWSRSFNDQRAAILDATMLLLESMDRRRRDRSILTSNGLVCRIGEIEVRRHERDGSYSVVARARYVASDAGHEPLVEMLAPERR